MQRSTRKHVTVFTSRTHSQVTKHQLLEMNAIASAMSENELPHIYMQCVYIQHMDIHTCLHPPLGTSGHVSIICRLWPRSQLGCLSMYCRKTTMSGIADCHYVKWVKKRARGENRVPENFDYWYQELTFMKSFLTTAWCYFSTRSSCRAFHETWKLICYEGVSSQPREPPILHALE